MEDMKYLIEHGVAQDELRIILATSSNKIKDYLEGTIEVPEDKHELLSELRNRIEGYSTRCIYRPEGVECIEMKCSSCGWNPEVEEKRIREFRERPLGGRA